MHFLPGQVSLGPAAGPQKPPAPPLTPVSSVLVLLTRQGRVLTLLDDDSLHLWEIVHHDGCAHLEEALRFQAPSRPGFDGARYRGAWPAVAARCSGGPVKVQWGRKLPQGWDSGRGGARRAGPGSRELLCGLCGRQTGVPGEPRVSREGLCHGTAGAREARGGEGVSQSLESGPVPLQRGGHLEQELTSAPVLQTLEQGRDDKPYCAGRRGQVRTRRVSLGCEVLAGHPRGNSMGFSPQEESKGPCGSWPASPCWNGCGKSDQVTRRPSSSETGLSRLGLDAAWIQGVRDPVGE